MKKFICAIILLLIFPVCAYSESSSFSVSPSVAQSMLESSLESGFAPQKDIQAMLDNAFLNGYDYYSVRYVESSNTFGINVAIDGFYSALTSLKNSKSSEADAKMEQAKEMIISHHEAILDMLSSVGMKNVNLNLTLIDDEYPMLSNHLLTIVKRADGERIVMDFAWRKSE